MKQLSGLHSKTIVNVTPALCAGNQERADTAAARTGGES